MPLSRTAMQLRSRAGGKRAAAATQTGMPPYRAVLSETAMPLAEMLRMRRPCMLGILSSVWFCFTSRRGAIFAPMCGAISPHLQHT